MNTSRGAEHAARRSTTGGAFGRFRRSTVAALGLLVVIGASAVGLHDVAESHLAAPSTSTHA